jgi:hypothetical protein
VGLLGLSVGVAFTFIIIITHVPYFTAVLLVLKTVRISPIKHFLFTVQPKII